MNSYDLNEIPLQVEKGIMSVKEAVKTVGAFICQNYRVFNLHKYDEDFRSELFVFFLEKGERLFASYKPELGDFFTFLYCFIDSLILCKIRSRSYNYLKEKVIIEDAASSLEEKAYRYHKTNYNYLSQPKPPYSYSPASAEELKKIFRSLKDEQTDKKILILAMKSSYYVTDEQIQKLSQLYKIDIKYIYQLIEYCRNSIIPKADKKRKLEEIRNYNYYHTKRCQKELSKLDNDDKSSETEKLKKQILYKMNRHHHNWEKSNDKLMNGVLYLRTKTKIIADILDICERQVNYYINCAKRESKKAVNAKKEVNC